MTPVVTAWAASDEIALGKLDGYPAGDVTRFFLDRYKVGSFSNMDRVLPTRPVRRGGAVLELSTGAPLDVTYTFGGTRHSLQDYLDRQRVTGLLVIRDGKILVERYQYDRSEAHRFVSWSMAKSITSLLVGVAVDKGLISSLDDRADKYAEELRGSRYGETTIRNLLRMASGVRFTEDYGGTDDLSRLWSAMFQSGPEPVRVLASFDTRDVEQGTRFKYATAETQVLCYVLRGATRRTIADITEQWLWGPIGAEADAAWLVGRDSVEYCGGGFNATLRDYGRLGLLLAHDGALRGRQLVPAEYVRDATDPARQPPGFRVGQAIPTSGYGYQFWLSAGSSRAFSMAGVFGQTVHIRPGAKLVIVHTAAWPAATGPALVAERSALVGGIVTAAGAQ